MTKLSKNSELQQSCITAVKSRFFAQYWGQDTPVNQLITDIRTKDFAVFNENHCEPYIEMEKQLIIETFKYAQVLHAMGDEMRAEQYYYNLTKQVK